MIAIKNFSGTKRVPRYDDIRSWAALVLKNQKKVGDISIQLIDAATSQKLNHQYRGKNKPTNVLSFPLQLTIEMPLALIGEILICPQVVQQEAIAQQKNYRDHFAHMVIHGCLHLLGFDHEIEHEAQLMEKLEINLLNKLNITNPYDDE